MAQLSQFYIDNVKLLESRVTNIRGNTVSDLCGENEVVAFDIRNAVDLRCKNNKALRIRSASGDGIGFNIIGATTAILIGNVTSRTNLGMYCSDINNLSIYNFTLHNCNRAGYINCNGTFRNIALSAYDDSPLYKIATGFYVAPGFTVDLDYTMHFGMGSLVESGNVTEGNNISENEIIYLDEPNDDLTPDYISKLIQKGTDNPLRTPNPDIGGIQSSVTDEITAKEDYFYNLIDNTFWNIENEKAAEVSLIKAVQSRILAGIENQERLVEKNLYIKTAESMLRFSELYPMYARYANPSKFKKRVMSMWYAGLNPATLISYNMSIGGYNLFPSFFKRMENDEDSWIIGVSYVADDNWLLGYEGLKYGIFVDVLGLSTLSQSASGECYNNVMKSVADVATVRWLLYDEPQPPRYFLFTDMWNNFEKCTLDNMIYNDDFNISMDIVPGDGEILSPLIPTESSLATGVSTVDIAPTGDVEISLLDRSFSETLSRNIYYRQGEGISTMSDWEELEHPIGEHFTVSAPYMQFKINASNVLRQVDYEFVGLCLRPYTTAKDWTRKQVSMDEIYLEFSPGMATLHETNPPDVEQLTLTFPDDGLCHECGWVVSTPKEFVERDSKILRFTFVAPTQPGTARVRFAFIPIYNTYIMGSATTIIQNISITGNALISVDIDVSDLVTIDVELLHVIMSRDSSHPSDTLADRVAYLHGRSLL